MKKVMVLVCVLAGMSACKTEVKTSDVNSDSNAIKVKTAVVLESIVSGDLRYSGTVEASSVIPLTFQINGTVEKVLVDAGDKVSKNQLLAIVDQTDAKNMCEMNQAKYEQAKDAYDRLKTVHEKGSLAEIKWVEMQSNLDQAQSSLALAKNNLEKCFLRASTDGFVGKRNVEPGMSALTLTDAAIELVEIDEVLIKISVPENEISKVAKEQKVSVVVSALDNQQFNGKVKTISPIADAISRTYSVKVVVANPNHALKPGMVCDVSLQTTANQKKITIPYQAVTQDANKHAFVYVIDEILKNVHKRKVVTGSYFGTKVEIREGLQCGQLIVVEGKEKLSDNASVEF